MKKTIKIRFVEHEPDKFGIQRRTWFGWWTFISYYVSGCCGSVGIRYSGENKESLLDEVLDKFYSTTRKYVKIIEHPMIRVY